MATLCSVSGGGRFEEIGSYVRAKRVGPFVFVAGTAAVEPSGRLHVPGNTYAQTLYVFERIREALRAVGAEPRHVTRTRAFLADIRDGGEYARAHGVVFKGIPPVSTGVGAQFPVPGMMVEIEVENADFIVSGSIDDVSLGCAQTYGPLADTP